MAFAINVSVFKRDEDGPLDFGKRDQLRHVLLLSVVLLFQLAVSTKVALATTGLEPGQSPHGALKIPCGNCHTPDEWMPVRPKPQFDHNKTGFPIRGMHTTVPCEDCHINRVFSKASTQCQDCHFDPHKRRNSVGCAICHTEAGWSVSSHGFIESPEHTDRFPLFGAHAAVECYSCHKVGTIGRFNRQGLSVFCNSCHMPAFRGVKNPNHVALGYSTDCLGCHHSFDTWAGATQPPGLLGGMRRR